MNTLTFLSQTEIGPVEISLVGAFCTLVPQCCAIVLINHTVMPSTTIGQPGAWQGAFWGHRKRPGCQWASTWGVQVSPAGSRDCMFESLDMVVAVDWGVAGMEAVVVSPVTLESKLKLWRDSTLLSYPCMACTESILLSGQHP